MKTFNLILGSGSPRRFDLLMQAGLPFVKRVIEVDESFPANLPLDQIAEYVAKQKAHAHKHSISESELLITADTIVVYNNSVYGKPKNEEEAIDTLLRLSNQVHLVYTGTCIYTQDNLMSFTSKSEVKFGKITQDEAKKYIKLQSPLDKAGSYGIQDWIGNTRIEWIKGSYTNILGLPMAQLWDKLKTYNIEGVTF